MSHSTEFLLKKENNNKRSALKSVSSFLVLAGFLSTAGTNAIAADLEPVAEEAPAVALTFTEKLAAAFKNGNILLDTRTRYEFADQSTFVDNADALTFRARFGFETAELYGFKLLAEGDFNQDLGVDNFNDAGVTATPPITVPVIADPDSQRLNRLHLTYQGIIPDTKFIGGRQRIKLDNDRFIGNVGFRQNEQTFDAIRVQNTSIENLTVDYTFLWQVNRIFGSQAPTGGGVGNAGTADGNSHLANVSYALPFGKVTGYAYFLDTDDFAPALSNQTFGGRFVGNHKFDSGVSVGIEGEFAHQTEFAGNPNDIDLNYFAVIGDVGYKGFSLRGGIETLGSDGGPGFATPFATLHKFNGFADVFLATPAGGLRDLNIRAQYKVASLPYLGDTRVFFTYHDFDSEEFGFDIGQEFDFGIHTKPFKNTSLSFEYADFRTDGSPLPGPSSTDLRRIFLTLGFKI